MQERFAHTRIVYSSGSHAVPLRGMVASGAATVRGLGTLPLPGCSAGGMHECVMAWGPAG